MDTWVLILQTSENLWAECGTTLKVKFHIDTPDSVFDTLR